MLYLLCFIYFHSCTKSVLDTMEFNCKLYFSLFAVMFATYLMLQHPKHTWTTLFSLILFLVSLHSSELTIVAEINKWPYVFSAKMLFNKWQGINKRCNASISYQGNDSNWPWSLLMWADLTFIKRCAVAISRSSQA